MPFELWCYSAPNDKAAELAQRHGSENWYDWANRHWGTKWGVYDIGNWSESFEQFKCREDVSPSKVQIYFMSAWSAPIPVIVELSRYFPSLIFTLSAIDEGKGWALRDVIHKGEFLRQQNMTDADDIESMAAVLHVES